MRVFMRTRAMRTRSKESLEEGREGGCRAMRTLWATKEPTKERGRRGAVVARTAAVVIVMAPASKASTATTAAVPATSLSSATGLVWNLLGRIVRSRLIPRHSVGAVHVHLGPVFLLLLVLLAFRYSSSDLIVCDVLGRERLVIGTVRGVGIRSAAGMSPTRSTARSMSSAPTSESGAMTVAMTTMGTRAPRVLVPILPASRLDPALPELGAVESRLAGGPGGSAVDASASIVLHVPIEVSWPSHIAGLYLCVCVDVMIYCIQRLFVTVE